MTSQTDPPDWPVPEIIYEDNHLLVVRKEPGVLSQADSTTAPDLLTILKNYLKTSCNKPGAVYLGLVHRLDQPVGGLMVFARTSKAASRLSAQIRDHDMAKYYLAVVDGCPDTARGTLQDSLLQDPVTRQVTVVPQDQGQLAWLDYCVLESLPALNRSLLAIRLGSGRGHQIRVQLAAHGWPIVGDRRYAGRNRRTRSKADIALFACSLGFHHPVGKQWLSFSIPPPPQAPWNDFQQPDLDRLPLLFS